MELPWPHICLISSKALFKSKLKTHLMKTMTRYFRWYTFFLNHTLWFEFQFFSSSVLAMFFVLSLCFGRWMCVWLLFEHKDLVTFYVSHLYNYCYCPGFFVRTSWLFTYLIISCITACMLERHRVNFGCALNALYYYYFFFVLPFYMGKNCNTCTVNAVMYAIFKC